MARDSIVKGKAGKPRDFPLWLHPSGRWCRKIKGRFVYFGREREAALAKWVDQRDDLLAGRTPRAAREGLSLADLANAFLTAKQQQLDQGELQRATFHDYHRACGEIIGHFGKTRLVADLAAEDFASLRSALAKRMGPVGLGNAIARIKVGFKWAYDNGLIAQPVRYGTAFKMPSARLRRLARADRPERFFEAAEIRQLIEAAPTVNLKAAILLGVNAGFGAADLSDLPLSAVDLDGGFVSWRRTKTGTERRCPLWPESIEAIRAVLASRKPPADPQYAGLLFVNLFGKPYTRDLRTDGFGQEFTKLLKRLALKRAGVGFYSLRHSHRSIADETGDQRACDRLMGHVREGDIATTYTHRVSDARLRAVTDHVRAWLFGPATDAAGRDSGQGEVVESGNG